MMRNSLRSVLSAVIFASSFGCGKIVIHPDEAAAVAAIQKLGGKVAFEGEGSDRRVIKVYLQSSSVRDADLSAVEKLPKLRNLFLGKTQISDTGLEHLRHSHELQTLSLNSTPVTDIGLTALEALTNLKTLNLQETKVTTAAVARLRKKRPRVTIAQ